MILSKMINSTIVFFFFLTATYSSILGGRGGGAKMNRYTSYKMLVLLESASVKCFPVFYAFPVTSFS